MSEWSTVEETGGFGYGEFEFDEDAGLDAFLETHRSNIDRMAERVEGLVVNPDVCWERRVDAMNEINDMLAVFESARRAVGAITSEQQREMEAQYREYLTLREKLNVSGKTADRLQYGPVVNPGCVRAGLDI